MKMKLKTDLKKIIVSEDTTMDHALEKLDKTGKGCLIVTNKDRILYGTFTYGLPGETKEDMIQTKRFIKSTEFSTVQESGTAEIEGTPLHALINAEKLSTYPSAVADKNYDRQKDGGKKWQTLVEELRNN